MVIYCFYSFVASRWYALLEKRPPKASVEPGGGAKGGTEMSIETWLFFRDGFPKDHVGVCHHFGGGVAGW